MSFATPLGLLALLGIPVVLFLHLFRRRLPEIPVAGLFLWASTAERAAEGRRRTQLVSHASLWLELLAVVLLALLLSGARIGVGGQSLHLVVVLDGTASMSALADGRVETAASRARDFVAGQIEDLPRDALVTVLVSATRPEVLVGPRAARDLAQKGLQGYEPTATDHALDPTLELARELGGGDARFLLVTDRATTGETPGFAVEAFGVDAQNAALRSARRIAGPDEGESVLADVLVFGRATPATLRVLDAADGATLGEIELELVPEQPRRVRVDVRRVPGPVRVRVEASGDGLALDDEVVLPVPAVRVVSLSSDLPPAEQVQLGLSRLVDAIPGLRFVTEGETGTLHVTATPGELAPGHHELVIAPRVDPGAGEELDAWLGPFLIDRRQELARGLLLDGVVWSAGGRTPPGTPLVLAEDSVLASLQEDGASLRLHLDLALARTNLLASPDWPVLFSNLVEAVRGRLPGVVDRVVPVGGTIQFRGGQDGRELALVAEDGRSSPGRGTGLVTFAASHPGLHRIVEGGEVVDEVGVHFVDPVESDLSVRAAFSRPAAVDRSDAAADDAAQSSGRSDSRLLALLLLVAVVAHAGVLVRRAPEVRA